MRVKQKFNWPIGYWHCSNKHTHTHTYTITSIRIKIVIVVILCKRERERGGKGERRGISFMKEERERVREEKE